MSITRITEFRARTGKEEELRDFLVSILPAILAAEGSESSRLLQIPMDNTIISGHSRVDAARRVGLTEVPVMVYMLPESQATLGRDSNGGD